MEKSINDNFIFRILQKQPVASIETITPKLAAFLLETSPGNRKIRKHYVDMLAEAMKRGEWRITSQGVGINKMGQLRDAHHRMNAVVQSGCSILTVVVTGLDDDAYEVTDIGVKRSLGDLMDIPSSVAGALSFIAKIYINQSPTVEQIKPIYFYAVGDPLDALTKYCNTSAKFYSSAPMKTAAVTRILAGEDAAYIMQQYRALCLLDFDAMSRASQALVRQVNTGKADAKHPYDTLARGMVVFDKSKKNITKIQIQEETMVEARKFVREVIDMQLKDNN